ncbi:MAG: hypothetical protein WDO69_06725 [Pseudomonadota bacterium]
MIKSSFLFPVTVAALSVSIAACSSSDSPSGGSAGQGGAPAAGASSEAGASEAGADAAGADSGGSDMGGSDMGGSDSAGDESGGSSGSGANAGSTSAGGSGSLPVGTSSCQYSVTGGATETSTDSPSVCGQSKVTTAYGGGFSATIAGGFQDAAGNTVTLACLIDSPTAPVAGASWSLGTATQSQGNCSFNIVSNAQVATIWSATADDAKVIGAATVKFKSVTLTHGVYKPADVYYFFDATIEATIPGQSEGAAEVKISGRYQVQTLPIGS